jgi:hypothetical protein
MALHSPRNVLRLTRHGKRPHCHAITKALPRLQQRPTGKDVGPPDFRQPADALPEQNPVREISYGTTSTIPGK